MTNHDLRDLCLSLAKANTESEVIFLLERAGFWTNPEVWQHYGGNENNYATIGNQQSAPDSALVEKITNSVDAVLMRECLIKGVRPDGSNAPHSVSEALKRFFKIYDGKLSNLDAHERTSLSQNILLVASGSRSEPSYSIIDMGEGQTPRKMPITFLSLNKSNKLRIPFVQGRFNMGSTGALQFCGQSNLQLIISKRNPRISEADNDSTKKMWGFTVVRRENPRDDMRNSTFKYLAPNEEVLMFESNSIPILPGDYPNPYGNNLDGGTFIKLYEYRLPGAYKSPVVFDLYNRLSLLLPNIALPVRMVERRGGYKGHTMESTLSGLSVRLEEDKKENVEPGFPSSSYIKVSGQEMGILIYAFKKEKREKYSKRDGIIFTVNGQSHGTLPDSFFERETVNKSYISDSILILVDCSMLNGRLREDLFMNSRDRLRSCEFRTILETQLECIVKDHSGLRALVERRRREVLEGSSKQLEADLLGDILKVDPTLSKLFLDGTEISNPLNLTGAGTLGTFEGKRFPTYFKLNRTFPMDNPKMCPSNRRFRLEFETDAENEYFTRDNDPGEFTIEANTQTIDDYALNLWNGKATLTASLPKNVGVGDLFSLRARVFDASIADPFFNELYIGVGAPEEAENKWRGGSREAPPSTDPGDDRKTPARLAIPKVTEVRRDKWGEHKFNECSSLSIEYTNEHGYEFYINMDNKYLKYAMKVNTKSQPELLELRFKNGIALIGLSLLHDLKNLPENHADYYSQQDGAEQSPYERISRTAKAIALVLLPLISSLGGDALMDIKNNPRG